MEVVLPRVYFGNIAYYSIYSKASTVVFEPHEHFIKQSYRNRCAIVAANAQQNLIVPVQRKQKRNAIKQLEIVYAESWQRVHWGAIVSSYKMSPYFDHYEHIFHPFFNEYKPDTLWELNEKGHQIVKEILNLSRNESTTDSFQKNYPIDYRDKMKPLDHFQLSFEHENYQQVFEDRHGFQKNMSILDLIFNEGPNSASFL